MGLTYAVIGTGGLGGYYGGRLAQSGQDVHFLFHSDYQEVKANGLRVDSVKGDFLLPQVNAYNSTQEMPACDVILVCLKTLSNKLLKKILPPILHKNSVVILVQNGLEIEKELAHDLSEIASLPEVYIAGATAFICSFKVGKGHIRHAEYGELTLAAYSGNTEVCAGPCSCESILKQVCTDFEKAGVPAHYADDLNLIRWKKLVWNIPYNGLTVVLNASTDRLTFQADSRALISDLMREVIEAAKCCGADIPMSFIDSMLKSTEVMPPYSPSMRLDYEAQRPMEIRTMYTNPINVAKQAGYEMKKVEVLEQQLRFLESMYDSTNNSCDSQKQCKTAER